MRERHSAGRRLAAGLGWDTPRIGAERPCLALTCPGSWVFDEVYGWMHSPRPQAECVTPPTWTRLAVIQG